MWPEDLRRLLRARPFQPFRFFVHETTSFEVRHPEAAAVMSSTVTVFKRGTGPDQLAFDQEVVIALLHITHIECLPMPFQSNGATA
jgi:hypothetical protein